MESDNLHFLIYLNMHISLLYQIKTVTGYFLILRNLKLDFESDNVNNLTKL